MWKKVQVLIKIAKHRVKGGGCDINFLTFKKEKGGGIYAKGRGEYTLAYLAPRGPYTLAYPSRGGGLQIR